MRKRLNRSLLTLGAAIVAVALAASSAAAASWTVVGSPDGNVGFSGETRLTLEDPSGHLFQLDVPGTGQDLTVSGVNLGGCQNLIHNGDAASISGTYDADEPVTITENP